MPPQEAELLRLAIAAHEAASAAEGWPLFLEQAARAVHADITVFQRHYLSQRRSQALVAFGINRSSAESYNTHYSALNVWRNHGSHTYVEGTVVRDEEQYPRALLKRTEFYNDYLIGNRGTRCIAGVIDRQDDVALVLTAMRDEPRHPFGAEEIDTIKFLLPHLMRAFETRERLKLIEAGEAALHALAVGILLLAADGRILFANRAAERMLRAGDGLDERDKRLAASSRDVEAALQKLIRYAAAPAESADCPRDVLVSRPSGRRPYHVAALPLRQTPAPFVGTRTPAAMVVVRDPEDYRPVGLGALKQAFGLTNREALFAVALAEGHTLRSVAGQLDIRYETARTHLRRILSKTGMSRQSELIALLERISRQTIDRS